MAHKAVLLLHSLIAACLLLFSPGRPVPMCQARAVNILSVPALTGFFLPPAWSTHPPPHSGAADGSRARADLYTGVSGQNNFTTV